MTPQSSSPTQKKTTQNSKPTALPTPEPDNWTMTIKEENGELAWELTGDAPDYFTMYGLLLHLVHHDLINAYEGEMTDASGP